MNIKYNNVVFSVHAVKRMHERHISKPDVIKVLDAGEVVETYPDDFPFPSYLLLGKASGIPLHVVVGYNSELETCAIITVYIPDPDLWESDCRTRRK